MPIRAYIALKADTA